MLLSIVLVTVVPNEIHVLDEMIRTPVHVVTQLFLYCAEIHRSLDNVKIVHYIEFDWIHWLRKPEGSFLLHGYLKKLGGSLLPGLSLFHLVKFFNGNARRIR